MPIPAYQLIPQATDQLSQSQSDILNNFTAIQGLIDVNHAPFSDGTNYGKHKWINFPVQTGLPGSPSQFASGEVGLYNQLPTANPITGVDELFINKIVSGGTAVQIPLTASILSTNNAPGNNSSGWTYLPSGIVFKWGNQTCAGNSAATILFPTGPSIPVFNQIFTMSITTNNYPAHSNQLVTLGTFIQTQFTVFNRQLIGGSSTVAFQYLAIGY
jgi:hypothetical protein